MKPSTASWYAGKSDVVETRWVTLFNSEEESGHSVAPLLSRSAFSYDELAMIACHILDVPYCIRCFFLQVRTRNNGEVDVLEDALVGARSSIAFSGHIGVGFISKCGAAVLSLLLALRHQRVGVAPALTCSRDPSLPAVH